MEKSLITQKSRWCARGFESAECLETFTHGGKITLSYKLLFVLALLGWSIEQMDVKTILLWQDRHRRLYGTTAEYQGPVPWEDFAGG